MSADLFILNRIGDRAMANAFDTWLNDTVFESTRGEDLKKKKKLHGSLGRRNLKWVPRNVSEIKGDRMRYNHISQVSFLLLKYGASTKVTCGKARSAAVPVAMRSIWLVPGN